ncbi:unnamed protein product [Prorocentrum cordatum]|uniref:Uncharacterized protein n=1 Tax=Prorocentrum cordatum TaxID=2364126 RepID=A0ABN9PI81_9DINO|nr:unnamed protein product [Polarella glacialis]
MAPRLCCEVTPMLNTSCASSTTNSMTRQQHACKERKDVLDIFGSSPRRGSELLRGEGGPAEGPGSGRHCKSPARGGGPRGRPTWQARPTRCTRPSDAKTPSFPAEADSLPTACAGSASEFNPRRHRQSKF